MHFMDEVVFANYCYSMQLSIIFALVEKMVSGLFVTSFGVAGQNEKTSQLCRGPCYKL